MIFSASQGMFQHVVCDCGECCDRNESMRTLSRARMLLYFSHRCAIDNHLQRSKPKATPSPVCTVVRHGASLEIRAKAKQRVDHNSPTWASEYFPTPP